MAAKFGVTENISDEDNASFGRFKVGLADILTTDIILSLATFFMFSPAKIDEIRNAKGNPGNLMISLMEERGQINPHDISPLLNALDSLKLYGLVSKTREIFLRAEDKANILIRGLRMKYALWYNKIQPIPYIRDKIFCVDEIFIDSGVEIVKMSTSMGASILKGPLEKIQLKSFRDIFDNNIVTATRIILEGDPGYGKSTCTLQAAYDWCHSKGVSPLKNIDIFILLPLRLLGSISSIYEAIRLVLMPADLEITNDQIKEILSSYSSGVIVLDGYDEYPDKDSGNETDVIKIIKGDMFAKFRVIISTRSSSMPKYVNPAAVIVRLTGFDEKCMDEYIRRAVVGDDVEAGKKIKNLLNSSPVINDICQVPLFCVMFAHIVNDDSIPIRFSSVTSFFKYVMTSFYSHMWKKKKESTNHHKIIPDYSHLNKLAFDGLTGKNQKIVWPKEMFIEKVGSSCCEELCEIGVLVEEEILVINETPGTSVSDLVKCTTVVYFYHKLFVEWYAANYLSEYAGRFFSFWLSYILEEINPVDLQFVFRFACGLNRRASDRIIRYLKGLPDGQSFASLCFFEQSGEPDEVSKIVKDLCSGGMTIKSTDSRLLQRSNLQLLEIASKQGIQINFLELNNCFKECEDNTIVLHSGLTLTNLSTVEKIHVVLDKVEEISRVLSEEEVNKIFRYGLGCTALKELSFEDCLLPLSFSLDSIPEEIRSRNVKIFWCRYGYRLNLQSGVWEVDDLDTLTALCSNDVYIYGSISPLLQRYAIKLLENASNYEIPITGLHLIQSFRKIEADKIVFHSGLHLACPASVKKLVINTKNEGREISETEVIDLLVFVQQSCLLEKLWLYECLLPQSIPAKFIPSILKSKKVEVDWIGYKLNLQSGLWMYPGTRREITETEYVVEVQKFRSDFRDTDWQRARVASKGK